MKKNLILSVLILGMMILVSFAQENPTQEFVNKAIMANRYEIALAQQANERSSNEALRAYNNKLIEEHQLALGELEAYARSNGLEINDRLDEEHQGRVNSLGELELNVYDNSYRDAAISSHESSIALFEDATRNTDITDETLRSWISSRTETLKSHLTEAQQLNFDTEEDVENTIPPVGNESL